MFVRLDERATIPKAKTSGSAGFDICSLDDCIVNPGEVKLISTGIALDQPLVKKSFPAMYFALHIRSSIALKRGLILANGVGVIDIDYPDEIKVMVYNPIKTLNLGDDLPVEISAGERIAQLILQPYIPIGYLTDDEMRIGGFGSTGK